MQIQQQENNASEYAELKKILEDDHIWQPSDCIRKKYYSVCALLIACGLFNIKEKDKFGFEIFKSENIKKKPRELRRGLYVFTDFYNIYNNKKRSFAYINDISKKTHALFTFLKKGDVTSTGYKGAKKNLISFVEQNEDIDSCIKSNQIPRVQLVDTLAQPNDQNPIYVPSFFCDIQAKKLLFLNKITDSLYSVSHDSIKLIDIFSSSNPEDEVRKNTLFKPLINNIFNTTEKIHLSSDAEEKEQLQEDLYDLLVEYIELKTVLFDRPLVKHAEAHLYTFDVIGQYRQFLDDKHVIGLLKRFFEQYESVIANYRNEEYESIFYEDSINIIRLNSAKNALSDYSLLEEQYFPNNPNNNKIDVVLKCLNSKNEKYKELTKAYRDGTIATNFTVSMLLETDPSIKDPYLHRARNLLSYIFSLNLNFSEDIRCIYYKQIVEHLISFSALKKEKYDKDKIHKYLSDVLSSDLPSIYRYRILCIYFDFIPKQFIKRQEFLYLTLIHVPQYFFEVIHTCGVTKSEYSKIKRMIQQNSALDDKTKKQISKELNEITIFPDKRIMVAFATIAVALSFPFYILLAFFSNEINVTKMHTTHSFIYEFYIVIVVFIILAVICIPFLFTFDTKCKTDRNIDKFGYNEICNHAKFGYDGLTIISNKQIYAAIFAECILIIPSFGLIFSGIFPKMNSIFFPLQENLSVSSILSPSLGSLLLVILIISVTLHIRLLHVNLLFNEEKCDTMHEEKRQESLINVSDIIKDISYKPVKLETYFENKVPLYQHQDTKPDKKQSDHYENNENPPSYDEVVAIESTFSNDNKELPPPYK